RSAVSGERLSNAPLALDLHYILTAYGRADFQAEILLGYAMHLLHECPMLDRAAVRRALNPSPLDVSMLPPAFQALAASDLADQRGAAAQRPPRAAAAPAARGADRDSADVPQCRRDRAQLCAAERRCGASQLSCGSVAAHPALHADWRADRSRYQRRAAGTGA